jgi:hypothetical protein
MIVEIANGGEGVGLEPIPTNLQIFCAAFSWSLPTLGYGLLPFSYFIFLLILLIHRYFHFYRI